MKIFSPSVDRVLITNPISGLISLQVTVTPYREADGAGGGTTFSIWEGSKSGSVNGEVTSGLDDVQPISYTS